MKKFVNLYRDTQNVHPKVFAHNLGPEIDNKKPGYGNESLWLDNFNDILFVQFGLKIMHKNLRTKKNYAQKYKNMKFLSHVIIF